MDTPYQIEKSIIEEILLNAERFGFDELKRIKPLVEEAYDAGHYNGYHDGYLDGLGIERDEEKDNE